MNCKNCGAVLEEKAVFCGNCGTPIQKNQNSAAQSPQQSPTQQPPQPMMSQHGGVDGFANQALAQNNQLQGIADGSSTKVLKIAIPVVVAVIVLGIVLSVGAAMLGSAEKTTDKFMKAFDAVDGEGMYEVTSKTCVGVLEYYMDTLSILSPESYEEEVGDDSKDYIKKVLIEQYESDADYFFDALEYHCGEDMTTSYEVVDIEKMSKEDLKRFNTVLERLLRTDKYKIKDVMIEEIAVEARSQNGKNKEEKSLYVVLVKEGSQWSLLSFDDDEIEVDDLTDIDWEDLF